MYFFFQNKSESSLTVLNNVYNLDIMLHPASPVADPIMDDSYAFFFNCTAVVRASDPIKLSIEGWDLIVE